MTGSEYDAIIVGASFAGLTVARELRGEVLLLDAHEVGSHQTSACGHARSAGGARQPSRHSPALVAALS